MTSARFRATKLASESSSARSVTIEKAMRLADVVRHSLLCFRTRLLASRGVVETSPWTIQTVPVSWGCKPARRTRGGDNSQRRTPNACPMRRRGSCVGYCRIRLGDREGSNAVLEFFHWPRGLNQQGPSNWPAWARNLELRPVCTAASEEANTPHLWRLGLGETPVKVLQKPPQTDQAAALAVSD
jgi:hypothetical protein